MESAGDRADERAWQARRLAGFLYLSAAIMVVVGIALGFVVTPALFALVAVGLADVVLAPLRERADRPARRAAATPMPRVVEPDPSYNPYARED